MKLATRYTLTADEALRGTRAFKRFSYGLSMAAGALLLLAGLAAVALAPAPQRAQGAFLALNGGLFLALPEAALRFSRWRRKGQDYPPVELELDDDGLVLRTEARGGGLPWSAFRGVDRRAGFWIFRITPRQAVMVPAHALDPAASAELAAFLTAKGLLKP